MNEQETKNLKAWVAKVIGEVHVLYKDGRIVLIDVEHILSPSDADHKPVFVISI